MNFLDRLVGEAKKKKKQVQTAVTGRGGLIDDIQGAASTPFKSAANFQNAQKDTYRLTRSLISNSPVFKAPTQAYKILDNSRLGDSNLFKTNRAFGAGLERSAVGTAQGISGIVDLASPGKGTNAYSKLLNQTAKNIDQGVKRNNLPTAPYKIGQFTGDLATGGVAGKAIGLSAKTPQIITNVTKPLANGNFLQRATGQTIRNMSNPAFQAANAGWTAAEVGKTASRGNQVRPVDIGVNLAIGGVGFPAAAAVGREALAPVARAGVNKLRQSNVIAPSRLKPNELDDLNIANQRRGTYDMDDATRNAGVAAAERANVDFNDANAVQNLVRDHQIYNNKVRNAGGTFTNAAQQLDRVLNPRQLSVGGAIKRTGLADDLSPEQNEYIAEYAEMLKGLGQGNGVDITADGRRVSNNFRSADDKGKRLTNADWFDRARADIESGKAGFGASDDYATLPQKPLDIPDGFDISPTGTAANATTKSTSQLQPTAQAGAKGRQQVGSTLTPSAANKLETQLPVNSGEMPTTQLRSQSAKQLQKAQESPLQQTVKSSTSDDGIKVKVIQRGGEKKVQVGHITLPKNLVDNVDDWKDVGSTLKTIDRNIEASAPSEAQYRRIHDFLIEPRGQAVTKMVDEAAVIKGELKDVVNQFGLKNKNVRADVMKFGEKKVGYDELVAKYGQQQADNIVNADKWFRGQYDRLLDETNAVLRKYNLSEIPKRDNYYTHFSEPNAWSNVGLKLKQLGQRGDVLQETGGTPMRGTKIDPKMLGQSEFTTPKRQYNPFAQRRTGEKTDYDAVKAFEKYLMPTLHNKHLTESVVKTRMVTKAFQEATAESKNLPVFIRSLQEYGNNLAGKSAAMDRRWIETKGGQQVFKAMNYLQKQAGRNTILGSVRSAIMQTAAIPQGIADAGAKNMGLGLLQQLQKSSLGQADEVNRISPFIRRRYATHPAESVLPSKLRSAEKFAGFVFEAIEETSTKSIWRANLAKVQAAGVKGQAAVREADRLTERIVAGRQVGERPEFFTSVMGNTVGQFQLEVNNIIQQLGQDWRKNPSKYIKFFAATYLFNELLYEPTFGDKPLIDPVEAAMDTFENAKNGNIAGAVGRIPGEVLSNVIGGQLAAGAYPEYGINLPGIGRTPTREQFFGDTSAGRYGGSLAALSAITNPQYLIPGSFGLAQVKRTVEGLGAFNKGESATSKGDVRFEINQSPANAVKAGLFGQYGTSEGKTYLREQNDKLKGKETTEKQSTNTTDTKNSNNTLGGERMTAAEAVAAGMTSKEAKAFLKLSAEEQRSQAAIDPDIRALYDEKKTIEKAFTKPELRVAGLSDKSNRVLNRYNRLTDEGKKKFDANFNDSHALKEAQMEEKKRKGENNYDLEREFIPYKLAKELGAKTSDDFTAYKESPLGKFQVADQQYQLDKKNNKISSIDDYKKQDELSKLQIQSKYSKEAVEIMDMSEKRIDDYLASASTPQELKNELLALDADSVAGGLYKYSKLDGASGSGRGRGRGGKGKKLNPSDFKLPTDNIGSSIKTANLARAAGLKGGNKVAGGKANSKRERLVSNNVRARKTLA